MGLVPSLGLAWAIGGGRHFSGRLVGDPHHSLTPSLTHSSLGLPSPSLLPKLPPKGHTKLASHTHAAPILSHAHFIILRLSGTLCFDRPIPPSAPVIFYPTQKSHHSHPSVIPAPSR